MAFLLQTKMLNVRSMLRPLMGMHSSYSNYATNSNSMVSNNTSPVHTIPSLFFSTESSTSSSGKIEPPPPPKRTPNVFALFVRDHFKELPTDMPVKEKFAKTSQTWRSLSLEERDRYKKMYADNFIQYRKEMADYLNGLSTEDKENYKQSIRDQSKAKTRQRIKNNLRKLNYPKRACSAFIYFLRDGMRKLYPDGKFPQVRSQEHINAVSGLSKQWRALSPEGRQPFDEMSENDRRRFHDELEQWKLQLAKPENEMALAKLERLSNKVVHLNKLSSPATVKQEEVKRQRQRQRSIARAVAKKAKAAAKAEKAKAKKKAAAAKAKGVKLPGSQKKMKAAPKVKKEEMPEDFD